MSALDLWRAWLDACRTVDEQRARWGYDAHAKRARERLLPLEEQCQAARLAFEAAHPDARHVGADSGVPFASPHTAAPARVDIDALNDWIETWWHDRLSHRAAVDAAMHAYGWYVARRLQHGLPVERAVGS